MKTALCPNKESLLALALGEASDLDQHVRACPACQKRFDQIKLMVTALRQSSSPSDPPLDDPLPAGLPTLEPQETSGFSSTPALIEPPSRPAPRTSLVERPAALGKYLIV